MSGGFSVGYKIPPERVVSTVLEKLPDQSKAKDGFVLYRVSTPQPVGVGEYALVLAAEMVQTTGSPYKFFDFGIDWLGLAGANPAVSDRRQRARAKHERP